MSRAVLLAALAALAGAPQAADRNARTYAASEDVFPNPERGLVLFSDLLKERDLGWIRQKGVTLVYVGVSLADYRGGPIDPAFLARLEQGFARVRAAGLKMILRFVYSNTLGQADAPKEIVLRHLEQLKPLFQAHSDVVAVYQAGFIGAWGEWHGSTNGLDAEGPRREILQALLNAVPVGRAVQVRCPGFKQKFAGGGPLTPAEAFKPVPRARIGHHNDAFFADANDMGTYDEPVKAWKDWVAQDGRFVPVGGETTAGPPRADGAAFLAELEQLRWSFMHFRYGDDLRKKWQAEGPFDAMVKRLGYRFSLVEASWAPAVRPGGELKLAFKVRNSGFAAPYNRRPAFAVLVGADGTRHAARLESVDPRRWEPGQETKGSVRLSVPAGLRSGRYRLFLWLPDDAPTLEARPEYAIRLANEKVWDAATGMNELGEVRVDPNAPGLYSSKSTRFAELR
jgi:hypothetical protein